MRWKGFALHLLRGKHVFTASNLEGECRNCGLGRAAPLAPGSLSNLFQGDQLLSVEAAGPSAVR